MLGCETLNVAWLRKDTTSHELYHTAMANRRPLSRGLLFPQQKVTSPAYPSFLLSRDDVHLMTLSTGTKNAGESLSLEAAIQAVVVFCEVVW